MAAADLAGLTGRSAVGANADPERDTGENRCIPHKGDRPAIGVEVRTEVRRAIGRSRQAVEYPVSSDTSCNEPAPPSLTVAAIPWPSGTARWKMPFPA